jgi:ubiquinone/menaquinone biosynthesis C-methylase UbiE
MARPDLDPSLALQIARNYERWFVPSIGAPVAEDPVRSALLRPGERVLDVACGTGVVARLAAEKVAPGGAVTGLDPNPAMLSVAREEAPTGTTLDWVQAPAEAIPFPEGSFDVALCGMGLQFFGDRVAGLREIRRVLVDGGRLVASLPGPEPLPFQLMARCFERFLGPEAVSFVDAVFSLYDGAEIRALATEAGFTGVEVRSAEQSVGPAPPAEVLWRYVESTPLSAAVAGADEELREALERDFVSRCAPYTHATGGSLAGAVRITTLIART